MNESGFVLNRRASCGNAGSPFSSVLNSRFPTAFFVCASGRCSPSSGCSLGAVDTEAFSSANPGVARIFASRCASVHPAAGTLIVIPFDP
eukprot:7238508-Prymnesium_polylepis.1